MLPCFFNILSLHAIIIWEYAELNSLLDVDMVMVGTQFQSWVACVYRTAN